MVKLNEAQRRLVHGALVEAHGEEVGDLMMGQLAVDWSDLATKQDLAHHREVLEARMDAAIGDATAKQTRSIIAWNGALLLGMGGIVLGVAQLMS